MRGMRRPLRLAPAWSLLALLIFGFALAAPTLVFDDGGFDYALDEVGYLHFTRDVGADVLTVRLDTEASAGSLPLRLAVVPAGLDREDARARVGIEATTRGLELTFRATDVGFPELLDFFHDLAPSLGFVQDQELFGGTTYMFRCGCQQQEETTLRVTLNRAEELIFVRLVVQTPFAYR